MLFMVSFEEAVLEIELIKALVALVVLVVVFIHSFILETYIAPLQDTTTQRRSQPNNGQRRRT